MLPPTTGDGGVVYPEPPMNALIPSLPLPPAPPCPEAEFDAGSAALDLGVIIPVREGSSRIKDKVLLPFGDHLTLLEWKLQQLCGVLPPERIYVSTDSANLRRLAAPYGVRFHDREPRLCRGHEATFSEVITGIVKDIPHANIAWVTVVVPLMSPTEYRNGFQQYYEQVVRAARHDSLFAANLVKEYLWWPDRPLNYQADRNHTISQHLPDIYRVTNGLYMRDKESILRDGYFLGPNPFKFLVSKVAGVDIDVLEDFQIARSLRWLYEGKSEEPVLA
jgi:N-acylneuraminate cytidylyltransferase